MLTDEQTVLVEELQALFLPTDINAQPYLTKLMQQFEADNFVSVTSDTLDDLERNLNDSGTMAANNLQGTESRRARCEGERPFEYPPFVWAADPNADEIAHEERATDLVQGLLELALSVNQAPPEPPTGDDDAA